MIISGKFVVSFALMWFSLSSMAQAPFHNSDFEAATLKQWTVIGNRAALSTQTVHSGRQALELNAGTLVQTQIKLKPLSKYKLFAWLKTDSGSDEVRLNIRGLGEHNTGIASARANWAKIELTFVTGEGQKNALIEIDNPENMADRKAWADDLTLEYLGDYLPEKVTGIKPLAQRIPKTDLGITQQPNVKTNWLLDARFGMFIHWGLYSGPAQGEWYMENKGISPEEYRKLAYPESGNEYFAADAYNADEWRNLPKMQV
jgi:alpha-L-fucosidase